MRPNQLGFCARLGPGTIVVRGSYRDLRCRSTQNRRSLSESSSSGTKSESFRGVEKLILPSCFLVKLSAGNNFFVDELLETSAFLLRKIIASIACFLLQPSRTTHIHAPHCWNNQAETAHVSASLPPRSKCIANADIALSRYTIGMFPVVWMI